MPVTGILGVNVKFGHQVIDQLGCFNDQRVSFEPSSCLQIVVKAKKRKGFLKPLVLFQIHFELNRLRSSSSQRLDGAAAVDT